MLLVLLDVLAVSIAALEQAETHQLGIVFSSHQLKVGTHRVVIQQGLVGEDLNDTHNYKRTVILLQNCDLQNLEGSEMAVNAPETRKKVMHDVTRLCLEQ